jgi:hypothetical protein
MAAGRGGSGMMPIFFWGPCFFWAVCFAVLVYQDEPL